MANIQGIINVNSGYSVITTDALLESTVLKLWIYEGTQGNQSSSALTADEDRPAAASYELRATSVGYEDTKGTSFQIAPLVRDYVESRIVNGVFSTRTVWVDYQLTTTIDGVEATEASVQCIGVDGYVYTSDTDDGLDKALRLSVSEVLNLKGEIFKIPVLRNFVIAYTFKNEGVDIVSGTLGISNESDEQVSYLTNVLNGVTFDCDEVVISHGLGDITTNGTFSADANWTLENDFTIANGVANLTADDLNISRCFQAKDVLGESFTVAFEVTNYTGAGTASMRYPFPVDITGNGVYTATGVGLYDRIQFQGETDDLLKPLGFDIDNVRVHPASNVVVDTITIRNIEECKYDPRRLTFVNKYGALQDVWMFKNSNKTIEVKSDTLDRMSPIGGGNIERASKVKVNSRAIEKMTLNSGFYPEDSNVLFEELLQSEKVWMWNLEFTPRAQAINITDTSINLKDSITDKAINYTINIELAYNKYKTI